MSGQPSASAGSRGATYNVPWPLTGPAVVWCAGSATTTASRSVVTGAGRHLHLLGAARHWWRQVQIGAVT